MLVSEKKYVTLFNEPQWSSDNTSRQSSGRPGFDAQSWLQHIIHLCIVYIHRIHHRPTDGDVKWRSCVSELYSRHVIEPAGSFIFSLYISDYPSYFSSSIGWGRKMSVRCIGAVLPACKRTRVAVVEFQVFLYPNSVSPFFPLYAR